MFWSARGSSGSVGFSCLQTRKWWLWCSALVPWGLYDLPFKRSRWDNKYMRVLESLITTEVLHVKDNKPLGAHLFLFLILTYKERRWHVMICGILTLRLQAVGFNIQNTISSWITVPVTMCVSCTAQLVAMYIICWMGFGFAIAQHKVLQLYKPDSQPGYKCEQTQLRGDRKYLQPKVSVSICMETQGRSITYIQTTLFIP